MLPHLNCIIVKDNRYHWCQSMFTDKLTYCILLEVKLVKDNYTKVKGYDILMKDGKIKLITILSVNDLNLMQRDRMLKITPIHKMAISEKMNYEIVKKMLEYGKSSMQK
jgi:hypothetical protein